MKPHLTIKTPFQVHNRDFHSRKHQIKQPIQRIPPADIQTTKPSTFPPTKNLIYFKLQNTHALQSLFHSFN
ncbi:2'-5' RNA ligase family protein, partial [Staphylococcus pettenkoferi]|uniref:2'-5' RNA ligase family protein n=1 Tax=Staphylococcus pettenkoferi TaxID=170573 RepID=UPI0030B918E8